MYHLVCFRSWEGLLTPQKTSIWTQWRKYRTQNDQFKFVCCCQVIVVLAVKSAWIVLLFYFSTSRVLRIFFYMYKHFYFCVLLIFFIHWNILIKKSSVFWYSISKRFCFSQSSPRLHHSWRVHGIGFTLRRLCQFRCLRLPLRVCQDLHEDDVICWHCGCGCSACLFMFFTFQ